MELKSLNESLAAFGPPALFVGEDRRRYDGMCAEFMVAVNPNDFIEQMLTRDIVDLEWDILRLRRLKAGVYASAIALGLGSALAEQKVQVKGDFVDSWIRKEPTAIKQMNEFVTKGEVDLDRLMADCLSDSLDHIDRLDLHITRVEARRNAHLREIEQRRAALGSRLRSAVAAIEAKPTSHAA